MRIAGLQPFTLSDYPGCCAAIIFTIGCNFECPYCHNTILLSRSAKPMTHERIFEFLNAKQDRLEGVVITGGEPTIQPDLNEFIQQIKKFHYKVKLDTNGSNPAVLKELMNAGLVDYIAMDIKAPMFLYHQLSGVQVAIKDIEKSMDMISHSGINHMFRTTWDKRFLTQNDIDSIKALLPENSHFVLQNCIDPY